MSSNEPEIPKWSVDEMLSRNDEEFEEFVKAHIGEAPVGASNGLFLPLSERPVGMTEDNRVRLFQRMRDALQTVRTKAREAREARAKKAKGKETDFDQVTARLEALHGSDEYLPRTKAKAPQLESDNTSESDESFELMPVLQQQRLFETTFYNTLVKAGGRPLYPIDRLHDVTEHPEQHEQLLRPWKTFRVEYGTWEVFRTQASHWHQFGYWQHDNRGLSVEAMGDRDFAAQVEWKRTCAQAWSGDIWPSDLGEERLQRLKREWKNGFEWAKKNRTPETETNCATLAEYADAMKRRLAQQDITRPFDLKDNPRQQDAMTTWLEYVEFECWCLEKYTNDLETLQPGDENAEQKLLDSGVLYDFEKPADIRNTMSSTATLGFKITYEEVLAAFNVARSEFNEVCLAMHDDEQLIPHTEKHTSAWTEALSKLDSIKTTLFESKKKYDCVGEFIDASRRVQKAEKLEKQKLIVAWAKDQIPQIEAELAAGKTSKRPFDYETAASQDMAEQKKRKCGDGQGLGPHAGAAEAGKQPALASPVLSLDQGAQHSFPAPATASSAADNEIKGLGAIEDQHQCTRKGAPGESKPVDEAASELLELSPDQEAALASLQLSLSQEAVTTQDSPSALLADFLTNDNGETIGSPALEGQCHDARTDHLGESELVNEAGPASAEPRPNPEVITAQRSPAAATTTTVTTTVTTTAAASTAATTTTSAKNDYSESKGLLSTDDQHQPTRKDPTGESTAFNEAALVSLEVSPIWGVVEAQSSSPIPLTASAPTDSNKAGASPTTKDQHRPDRTRKNTSNKEDAQLSSSAPQAAGPANHGGEAKGLQTAKIQHQSHDETGFSQDTLANHPSSPASLETASANDGDKTKGLITEQGPGQPARKGESKPNEGVGHDQELGAGQHHTPRLPTTASSAPSSNKGMGSPTTKDQSRPTRRNASRKAKLGQEAAAAQPNTSTTAAAHPPNNSDKTRGSRAAKSQRRPANDASHNQPLHSAQHSALASSADDNNKAKGPPSAKTQRQSTRKVAPPPQSGNPNPPPRRSRRIAGDAPEKDPTPTVEPAPANKRKSVGGAKRGRPAKRERRQ